MICTQRPPARSAGRWPLLRWYISSGTLSVPQAAAPVAFALVTLGLTGEPSHGAAIMVVMTLAQILGAIPITGRAEACVPSPTCGGGARRVGQRCGVRLPARAAQRPDPSRGLPRALGISATPNEVSFVLAPVVAPGLGVFSPAFAVLVIAVLGATPALLAPSVDLPAEPSSVAGAVVTSAIALWLTCAAAGGATVAAVEIGAVAQALRFGFEPALAIVFTVPLCIASIAGGVWVSIRTREASRRTAVLQLAVMSIGAGLAAAQVSTATAVAGAGAGAVLIGAVLAPLGTYYSLMLDAQAPPRRRAEVFALLRTANAVGVILAGLALTALPLSAALWLVTGMMALSTLTAAAAAFLGLAGRSAEHRAPTATG